MAGGGEGGEEVTKLSKEERADREAVIAFVWPRPPWWNLSERRQWNRRRADMMAADPVAWADWRRIAHTNRWSHMIDLAAPWPPPLKRPWWRFWS